MATLLERLGRALRSAEGAVCCDSSSPALCLAVRCDKCGEIIYSRVEKAYDLEAEYDSSAHEPSEDEEPRPSGYVLHKELVGADCQNLVHLTIRLDAHKCMVARRIDGGQFVSLQDCE